MVVGAGCGIGCWRSWATSEPRNNEHHEGGKPLDAAESPEGPKLGLSEEEGGGEGVRTNDCMHGANVGRWIHQTCGMHEVHR